LDLGADFSDLWQIVQLGGKGLLDRPSSLLLASYAEVEEERDEPCGGGD
jgi:hypothetical protein